MNTHKGGYYWLDHRKEAVRKLAAECDSIHEVTRRLNKEYGIISNSNVLSTMIPKWGFKRKWMGEI